MLMSTKLHEVCCRRCSAATVALKVAALAKAGRAKGKVTVEEFETYVASLCGLGAVLANVGRLALAA